MIRSETFVSIVVVLKSYSEDHYDRLARIQKVLERTYSDYEVVIVVPGFDFLSAAQEGLVLAEVPCIRVIRLSSPVYIDVALGAGLEAAIGDFVILLDLQADPAEIVPALVAQCKSGSDVVVGVATQSRSLAYRFFRRFSTAVLRSVGYELPESATGLRCLSRRAVNAVTRIGRFYHQFHLRIQKTGFPMSVYKYSQHQVQPDRGLFDGVRELLRLVVFNSSRPLRLMSVVGFVGSLAAASFAAYSVLVHLWSGRVVEGWTTSVLFMSILFMLQFVMMAFFGEYLGRLLEGQGDQFDYAVVYERNSFVMVDGDRVNVLVESLSDSINVVQTGRDR